MDIMGLATAIVVIAAIAVIMAAVSGAFNSLSLP